MLLAVCVLLLLSFQHQCEQGKEKSLAAYPPKYRLSQQEKGKALTGEGANGLGKGNRQKNMQSVPPPPDLLPMQKTSKPGSGQ